ncbi:hypothetical protein BPTFM16_00117 [Altererythrobacter insulae]|nr:hypothetical protein BPTFM16_00117 [Altererythrobacter insulae]
MIGRVAALAFILSSFPAATMQAQSKQLAIPLCNGGTIEIKLGDERQQLPNGSCHFKACHAGPCRSKLRKSV